MRYKALLLDIDNTLYDYNVTHAFAKSKVIEYCMSILNFTKEEINSAYDKARHKVHIELCETAASHNRLLYFQKMLEILNVNPLEYSFDIYNVYWDSFLDKLVPFEGIYTLLEKYKGNICLVTDLTAHIQYRKVKKLGLEKYCNAIVTSEEAGHEKPHPYMFMLALQKLGLEGKDVCMIGDSFKKDVLGAAGAGIASVWFNHESKQESHNDNLISEVKSFNEIIDLV